MAKLGVNTIEHHQRYAYGFINLKTLLRLNWTVLIKKCQWVKWHRCTAIPDGYYG